MTTQAERDAQVAEVHRQNIVNLADGAEAYGADLSKLPKDVQEAVEKARKGG